MAACEKSAIEQTLGLLLIWGDGGLGFERVKQRLAVGIEEGLDAAALSHLNDLGIKMRPYSGRDAATNHQPVCFREAGFHQIVNLLALQRCERRAHFIELYRESLLIRNREINAAF